MTRHDPNLAAATSADKLAALKPVKQGRNLTQEVVARIAGEITGGNLAPGTRLPTEQELMAALGVSRTVVREAVAALKADGLIVTRQGSGAYVASELKRAAFRIDSDAEASLADVIEVMELRVAVEVEAAALAAERARYGDRRKVETALTQFTRAVKRGESAISEDFAFHQAIADATGNGKFSNFLTFLGRHVIPRQSIRTEIGTPDEQRVYLAQIERDHTRIVEAILEQNPAEARRAMRAHLARGLQRYRGLAERKAREVEAAADTIKKADMIKKEGR